jgi:O-antigen ligase
MLLTLTAIPRGTVDPWWEAMFECAVFALFALSICGYAPGGAWRFKAGRMLMPLALLVVFAFMQSTRIGHGSAIAAVRGVRWTISADPFETFRFALKMSAIVITGLLLLRHTTTWKRLVILLFVLIGIGVASALFGLFKPYWTHDGHGSILIAPSQDGYGQFANRNHFALLMEMTLGPVLGLALWSKAKHLHLACYLFAAGLLSASILLTSSRGGIISLLGQLIFLVLLSGSARDPRRPAASRNLIISEKWHLDSALISRLSLVALLFVSVGVIVYQVSGDSAVKRLGSITSELRPDLEHPRTKVRRQEIWRATWQMIKAHPVAGVGFGAYGTAITKYHDSAGNWIPQQAHNDYLELVASGGLIGTALGACFLVAFVKSARESLTTTRGMRRGMTLGALAGLFAAAVHSFVDFGLHVTVNALVFTALIVLAVAKVEEEGRKYRVRSEHAPSVC